MAGALLGTATTRIVYDVHRFLQYPQAAPDGPDAMAACVRRDDCARNSRQRSGSGPSRPRSRSVSATRTALAAKFRRKSRLSRSSRRTRPARRSALGGQRLDHLQQQGQAGPPVRTVFQPTPEGTSVRVRRAGGSESHPLLRPGREGCCNACIPNHTYEKVVFDPWHQDTWDVNDTVLPDRPYGRSRCGRLFSSCCRTAITRRVGTRCARIRRTQPRRRNSGPIRQFEPKRRRPPPKLRPTRTRQPPPTSTRSADRS